MTKERIEIEEFLLSPQQQRLWHLQSAFDINYFKIVFMISIQGYLDRYVLACAVNNIIKQHEILRTTFGTVPDTQQPVQLIYTDYRCEITEIDLSTEKSDSWPDKLIKIFEHEKQFGDDLTSSNVFPLRLIQFAPEQQVIIVNLPAFCADIATARIFTAELAQEYRAIIEGQSRKRDVLQYRQCALLLNELLQGEIGETGRYYWKQQQIFPLTPLNLPFWYEGKVKDYFLPRSICGKINTLEAAKIYRF
ncbi:MAG: condensation domain-containing protein, partial [Acidobacteriota bacterium]